jgi:Xaa-Pro aminopeptidase
VHDRGTGGPLEPGVVITVEPGIYIPENSPCDERWWGIAVRIEDDILITEDGYKNLSEMAPRTVEAIEAMMAQPSPLDGFLLPDLDDKN